MTFDNEGEVSKKAFQEARAEFKDEIKKDITKDYYWNIERNLSNPHFEKSLSNIARPLDDSDKELLRKYRPIFDNRDFLYYYDNFLTILESAPEYLSNLFEIFSKYPNLLEIYAAWNDELAHSVKDDKQPQKQLGRIADSLSIDEINKIIDRNKKTFANLFEQAKNFKEQPFLIVHDGEVEMWVDTADPESCIVRIMPSASSGLKFNDIWFRLFKNGMIGDVSLSSSDRMNHKETYGYMTKSKNINEAYLFHILENSGDLQRDLKLFLEEDEIFNSYITQ